MTYIDIVFDGPPSHDVIDVGHECGGNGSKMATIGVSVSRRTTVPDRLSVAVDALG